MKVKVKISIEDKEETSETYSNAVTYDSEVATDSIESLKSKVANAIVDGINKFENLVNTK